MGVFGTWCQICGLPVQHDHYIPMGGDMYAIYRGDPEQLSPGCELRVALGPEHGWLLQGVGLAVGEEQQPPVVEGRIHDGLIELPEGREVSADDDAGDDIWDRMVGDGVDARAAVHRACWELAGKVRWRELEGVRWSPELDRYQSQLFELEQMVDDGLGWMLVDPRLDTPDGARSRERIEGILRGRSAPPA